MHTLCRALIALSALTLGAVACGDGAEAGSSVNLTAADSARTIRLEPQDELTITLESNVSTGFRWVLATEPDARILSLAGSGYLAPETDLVGAPGQEIWTFRARSEGETSLVLSYERSTGETAGDPFELTVRVG